MAFWWLGPFSFRTRRGRVTIFAAGLGLSLPGIVAAAWQLAHPPGQEEQGRGGAAQREGLDD